MMDFELEQLRANPDWLVLLRAYELQCAQLKQESEEADGWSERLSDVGGVRHEHLSRIHGKLIALGLLNFQLTGRTTGVRYQLTTIGKQVVQQFESTGEFTDAPPLRKSA